MRETGSFFGGLALLALLVLPGCGGGSSSSPPAPEAVCTGTTPTELPSSTTNTMPVYQSTCAGTVNIPAVTLHICVPGSTTCEDVPNILIDYGSTGLRLSHTLAIAGELPQEQISGQGLYECYAFVSGYNFGPVATATITLVTQTVTVPVQISNSTLSAPSSCIQNTLNGLSAPFEPTYNGILGVLFPQDDEGLYYEGSGNTLLSSNGGIPSNPSLEVQNPVYLLPSGNNNGVMLTYLPNVPSEGASNVTGTLQFGVTSSDYTTLLVADQGSLLANYNGNASLPAFFDTGSNGYFIDNSTYSATSYQCDSGFWCVNIPNQSAILTGSAGSSGTYTLHFSIVNAQTLFATNNNDFSTLGGYAPNVFDAGFPAFLQGFPIGIGWGTICTSGCFLIVS